MYFLQQYPSREQALLPPLCELLYEKRPAEDSPRLMQKGAELPPEVGGQGRGRVLLARSED